MTACGIMGYCMETEATMEYWFNRGGTVFPKNWEHPVVGIVWTCGTDYATYFTGDPAWVYGIQWLPAAPHLQYLARDPEFAERMFQSMIKDFEAREKKPGAVKTWGPALGSVMCGYKLMFDPMYVCENLDSLWAEPGDKVAHDEKEMAIMYYMAHSMRGLGRVDWTCRTSSPTSMVFIDPVTQSRSYVVWNPRPRSETVDVYENDKVIGQMTAPAQALTCTKTLK